MIDSKLILATAYRSPYLFTVVAQGDRLVDIFRRRLSPGTPAVAMRWQIACDAAAYDVAEIIAEADTKVEDYVKSIGRPCRAMTFREARRILFGTSPEDEPALSDFFDRLVAEHQELARFVRILTGTGRVAKTDTWRIDLLIVVAMALAGAKTASS